MRHSKQVAAVVLGMWALTSAASAADAPAGSALHTTLPNGLRAIAVSAPDARVARVRVFLPITAAQEPAGKQGIAHLVEHLAFDPGRAGPDTARVQALALFSCYANAITDPWGVEYDTDCLPELLPQVLGLEARRLTHLDPAPADFEREKQVVREELALRASQSPWTDLRKELFRAAYQGGPYGADRGGTDSSVAALTLDDVVAFHAATHHAGAAVVAVEAPLAPSQVLETVKQTFGALPPGPFHGALPPANASATERGTVVLDRYDSEGMTVAMGFRLPRATPHEKLMAAMVVGLFEQQRLDPTSVPLPGEVFVQVVSRLFYPRAADMEELGASLADESARWGWGHLFDQIDRATRTALNPRGFDALKAWAVRGAAGVGGAREGRALPLARDLLAGDDLRWTLDVDSLAAGLDLPTFNAYVRSGLRAGSVKGVVHGRDSGRPQALTLGGTSTGERLGAGLHDAADRLTAEEVAPPLQAYRRADRRTVEQRTLTNGIPLHVVAIEDATGVQLGGVRTFATPRWERPGAQPGLLRLYDAAARYQSGYHEKGAPRLRFDAVWDATPSQLEFMASGPASRIGEMASTLASRISDRELNVQAWSFFLEHGGSMVALENQMPRDRATFQRFARLLGPQHPLLSTWASDPAVVRKFKYDQARSAHAWLTRTGNLRLLVAGGASVDAALAAAQAAMGSLPPPDNKEQPVPLTSTLGGIEGNVVAAFDRHDCVVTVSMPPIALGAPAQWTWGEHALVQQLVEQRLRRRLRSQEGLSYLVTARASVFAASAVLEVVVTTSCENAREILAIVRSELRALVEQPLEAEPVDRARLSLAGDVARRLESPDDAYTFLESAAGFGAIATDPVLAVLDADAQRVGDLLRQCVQPDRFAFSVEGPVLEEALEEFRW